MEAPTLPGLASQASTRSSMEDTLFWEGWDYGKQPQAIFQYDEGRQLLPYTSPPSSPPA